MTWSILAIYRLSQLIIKHTINQLFFISIQFGIQSSRFNLYVRKLTWRFWLRGRIQFTCIRFKKQGDSPCYTQRDTGQNWLLNQNSQNAFGVDIYKYDIFADIMWREHGKFVSVGRNDFVQTSSLISIDRDNSFPSSVILWPFYLENLTFCMEEYPERFDLLVPGVVWWSEVIR
jgi:hypothetical protein